MFVINNEICSQCGECQDICPCGAIEQQPDDSFKIDAEMCSDCAACQSVCPLRQLKKKKTINSLKNSLFALANN